MDGETTNPAARQWFESRVALGEAQLAAVPAAQSSNRHYRLLRMLYAVAAQDYARALEFAEGLVKDDPSDRSMLVLRSMISQRAGRPVEAWSGEKQDGEYWQFVQRFRLLHFPPKSAGWARARLPGAPSRTGRCRSARACVPPHGSRPAASGSWRVTSPRE